MKLLKRQIGVLPEEARSQILLLSVERLEDLGEALLDFATVTDLEDWLRAVR